MIKANELRKGNSFFGGAPARCIGRILTIIQEGVEAKYQMIGYGAAPNNPGIGFAKYEDIYPIPLTAEIMEKCGFEWRHERYDGETKIWSINLKNKSRLFLHFEEDQSDTGYSVSLEDDGNHSFAGHDIFYIHQLQNLYFALTGEELAVNL